MSNTVTRVCRPLQVSAVQKAIVMCLADHSDDQGRCWPAIPSICLWTCLSRTSVIDGLEWLTNQAIVVKAKGKRNSNVYTLALDRIKALCPLDPDPDEPSASRTGTPGVPVREADSNRYAGRTPVVRQADSTGTPGGPEASGSINEASVQASKRVNARAKTPKPEPIDVAQELLPDVDRQTLLDWLTVRKAKKSGAITETAVKGVRREAEKAGISAQHAIETCCEASWAGFNAEWFANRTAKSTSPGASGHGKTNLSFAEINEVKKALANHSLTGGLLGQLNQRQERWLQQEQPDEFVKYEERVYARIAADGGAGNGGDIFRDILTAGRDENVIEMELPTPVPKLGPSLFGGDQ